MLKIKKIGNAIHFVNGDVSSVMPMTNEKETEVVINTLIEAVYQSTHKNEELQKSFDRSVDAIVTEYATEEIQPLLKDVTRNIPSYIVKSIDDSLSCAPKHLQGQVVKSHAIALARVYKDVAEMVLECSDTNLLYRSLVQKSGFITRDVEMLAEKLSEPLEKVKRLQVERQLSKDILHRGVEQGKIATLAHYGTFDKDVLDTARSIQKARNIASIIDKRQKKAIKSAIKTSAK
jgi:hypothetical protein